MHKYSRRTALKTLKTGLGGLAGISALGLAACDDATTTTPTARNTGPMSLSFWGSATRVSLTQQAINAYHTRFGNVSITPNATTNFNDYWPKLDKLVAARKTPDLIQMDMRYLAKYAKSGLMLDLTKMVYDQTIGLSDFDPIMLAGSKANNAIYGIPMGGNYQCMIYDTTLVTQSEAGAPPANMTWDTFASYMAAITQGLAAAGITGVYGCADVSTDLSNYEIWLRQHGKELYTTKGGLAFTAQDMTDWLNYWNALRKSGGCLPADVAATFINASGVSSQPLIKGKCVFGMPHSNEFESYQALTKNTLGILSLPLGDQPGLYLKPSQLISIASISPYATQAAEFINFIINDPAGIKAIGVERGIPGTRRGQALLRPNLTAAQLRDLDFTNTITQGGNTRLKEVLDPPNASQVADIFKNAAYSVIQGKAAITDATRTFIQQAQKMLG